MSILRVKKRENPYAQIDNRVLNDIRLSFKARGIAAYLLSKPDDWTIVVQDLINQSEKDGRESIQSGLRELKMVGYLKLEPMRDESGKLAGREYIFCEEPTNGFSVNRENRRSGKPTVGKTATTNTEYYQELNNTNTNSLSPAREEIEIPEPTHIWGDNTDKRLETVQSTLKAYFEKNSFRRREISESAKNRCDEAQFDDELDLWIRRNADDFQITQNPVKALTSGRSNFTSWLSQEWCRAKYLTHGNDTSTPRNGRVQQRSKIDAFPSREELERKYGVFQPGIVEGMGD